ncbi:26S proteasome non-ATPase regulatory subunit 2-like [Cyprinus carpio]|uniref:26S proteasome non-ATPase regulatory subunit 2-like n=1 Tax=Cyprinus carpio TaxID=7962 RepID=A0A9Q9YXP7_CYPCA|nr:26S proteasome non-ATPase regulatory subunit 2-like [Cyprinus carpio]
MTMSSERECLKYRLLGSQEELASWGHEYVRYVPPKTRRPVHWNYWRSFSAEFGSSGSRVDSASSVNQGKFLQWTISGEERAGALKKNDTYARWLPLGLGELNHLVDREDEHVVDHVFHERFVLGKECEFLRPYISQFVCHGMCWLCLSAVSEMRLILMMLQGVAVLGIALIAMGEEIGSEMALRTFGHLLRYGEPTLRRAVPLALALISVSNPRLNILDTLSKFSHDADPEVAHNAIFAMGMVGSGTNNARLAAMLRQLAQYHAKDPNNLFMVRLAQGLTHLGKGTLTLCPYHSDRQLMSQVAVAGLLTVLVSFLDVKNIILGKSHYVLYGLVAAMQPRMLVTFDEELRPLPVSVRVGQVCHPGQAGKPKAITGFQTHTTPVLLAHGERAELATEEYIPVTPILEGFVILRKNPSYDA